MIKKVFIFMIVIIFPLLLKASGTTSAILNLTPLAFDAGLDIASYGKSEPSEGLIYNPALAYTTGSSIGLSGGLAGLNMDYFSLVYNGPSPFNKDISLGAMVNYLNEGTINGFDENGNATGNISPSDLAFSGVIGWQIKEQLSIGARISVLHEKISDQNTGFGFDLGVGYKVNTFKNTTLNAGLTVLNVYSSLWGVTQPIGIGAGLVLDSALSGVSSLEYGLGLKMNKDQDYQVGGGVSFSSKFQIGSKELNYKLGVGYYYSPINDMLQGLRTGLVLGFLKNINLGYDLQFQPWGTENRLSVLYSF